MGRATSVTIHDSIPEPMKMLTTPAMTTPISPMKHIVPRPERSRLVV